MEHRINVSPLVGVIAGVMIKPFWEFLTQLQNDGRVTAEEVAALRSEMDQRSLILPDLVQEELRRQSAAPDT
jgi:hypothetical protein